MEWGESRGTNHYKILIGSSSWRETLVYIGYTVNVLLKYANCCTNSYYNLNPCGIFEKMTPSPGLGTIKINDGRKFLEFKAGVHQKCVKNGVFSGRIPVLTAF